MAKIQAIRGMSDILPEQTPKWQFLEQQVQHLLAAYGYQEIRMPIVEQTELFKRSIGEVTDIVEKEMYTFDDRNGDSLTLRPEGTAGCVRAAEQHGLLFQQQQRFWYAGPMFRHERPQKGRYRQFHQIGVEAFGMAGPDIDAEVISLTAQLWQRLGLAEHVTLELNSLGSSNERASYRAALTEYLRGHIDALDEDSQRRLDSNPLRILDSKHRDTQAILKDAPVLGDYLGEESRMHFEQLKALLDRLGVSYRLNPRLVRGLDYYGKTVFEWVTDSLGAQGTVCAGGRYDGLAEQLGGKATPAVGFAMGIERLILLMDVAAAFPDQLQRHLDLFIASLGEGATAWALTVAQQVRQQLPHVRVQNHCGGGGFKAQMKKADKSSALFACIIGEDEVNAERVTLKPLREQGEQQTLTLAELIETLKKLFP